MIENEDFKVDFQSLEETDLDTVVPGPAELIVNTGGIQGSGGYRGVYFSQCDIKWQIFLFLFDPFYP